MKPLFPFTIFLAVACATLVLGQATSSAPLGSTYSVWSSHTTASDGIQGWNATGLLSPTGRWITEETHFGSGMPDGYSSIEVVLDEPGTWQLWYGGGHDAPQSATTWWQPQGFLEVGAQPSNASPTISWIMAPANVGHGVSYTVTARGNDTDGNLAQVNIWKNGQPFASAGGGNGTGSDSGNPTSDNGPQTITFTAQAVDAAGATSAVITHVVTINAPVNTSPTVTLLAPAAQTVSAGTTLTISARATDADGNLSGHNLDIQRPAGDWNFQGGFATGEPFQGGPVGSGADSTRSASFTFTDVGTYNVRSGATDGSGWHHSATVAITVVAPPPAQFALVTSADAGGSISAGGTYTTGTTVMVTASPDATHDFAGWSGDAGGSANPLAVLMDRAKTVRANFSPKNFSLTTNTSGGGAVTPGGNYPYGTTVTITAAADATHRFVGWAGDASGSAPSIALTITRPLSVQAVFEAKMAQTISFPAIGDQSVGASFPLTVTSTSGLPVTLTVTGPATYSGGMLTLTGAGAVSVQASQPGDGTYLPAAPVTRTFNAAALAVLRYRAPGRTFLQTGRTPDSIPYVIQPNP